MLRNAWFSGPLRVLLVSFVFAGCGDDGTSDDGATDDGDGTSAGGGSSLPPLTQADCPTTPQNLALDPIAPYWNGLVALRFSQANKASVGYQDVQILDPALGIWSWVNANTGQRDDDDTFVSFITPTVTEQNHNREFKVRVRSQLTGCPPSDWAESAPFSLGDPLSGTIWVATFDPDQIGGYIDPTVTGGTGTATGPYGIDEAAPPRHTVELHADGTSAETFEFGVQSETPGDVFAGCAFKLAFSGMWIYDFQGSTRVEIFQRKLTSTAGSSCTNPPLAEIDLTKAGGELDLPSAFMNLYSVSYNGLLYSPPEPAVWAEPGLASALTTVFYPLSDTIGEDTSVVNSSFSFYSARYEKQ